MNRPGWHLDDVPRPFLSIRRAAFSVIVLAMCAVVPLGLLLGYDITNHQSPAAFFVMIGVAMAIGAAAGGVFGWTNTKSPRWQDWRRNPTTLTPGGRSANDESP